MITDIRYFTRSVYLKTRLLLATCLILASSLSFALSPKILVLGDSLSAGYGIKIEESWPVLLQNRLVREEQAFQVVNASISGQTSAEGLAQIRSLLNKEQPMLVILELGANDGLRGLSVQQMKRNLASIISQSQSANAKVLLLGMHIPTNYGRRYTQAFHAAFQELASEYKTGFVPFMLEPLIAKSEYIQSDGLHPTADAQPILLNHLWPEIKKYLRK